MPITEDRRGGQRPKYARRHRAGGLSADHLAFISNKLAAEFEKYADKDDRLLVADAIELILALLERDEIP
jgi:hypothetical protein